MSKTSYTLSQRYPKTFDLLLDFVTCNFCKYTEAAKRTSESSEEVTYDVDNEDELQEIVVAKEPIPFEPTSTHLANVFVFDAAFAIISLADEFLRLCRHDNISESIGLAMIDRIIIDIGDHFRLYDVMVKHLRGTPQQMWIHDEERDIPGWIIYWRKICEHSTRVVTKEQRVRNQMILEMFAPIMMDEGFATEKEFGIGKTKSAQKD